MFGRFKFINPEIAPNFEIDDAWLALKILLGFERKYNEFTDKVRLWFQKYLQLTDCNQLYLTDSGRTALYLLLKSLDLPKDTEVLIQGFSCIVVLNAVWQSGYKPIVCDIEPETFNFDLQKIEPKITTKTKVWIIQHTFGITLDMDQVQAICRRYNLILIEDCAQALGATFRGRLAGTFGQASIFSFGRDKVVSSVIGGAAVLNQPNPAWQFQLTQLYEQLPSLSRRKVIGSLIFTLFAGWILPLYHLGIGKLGLFFLNLINWIPPVYTVEESLGTSKFFGAKYSARLSPLLWQQLNKLNRFLQHRRQVAKIYSQQLGIAFYPEAGYLRFPLNLEKFNLTNPELVYEQILFNCRKQGIFLGVWYQNLFATNQKVNWSQLNLNLQGLLVVDRLTKKRILNLPTHIQVSISDAFKIAKIVQTTMQKYQNVNTNN